MKKVHWAVWLAAIVVLAVAGSLAASALAVHETFFDAYTRTPYSAAYAFPIHVVQAASPGWDVDFVIWSMLAAIAVCGIALASSISRLERRPAHVLCFSFAVTSAALSAFAIIQSSDVYFYVMYGRLYGVHGMNPYAFGDVTHLGDPIIAQILTFAGKVPFEDPYGPLWTLVAGLQSKLFAGADLFWSAWSFRAVAIVAALAAIAGILHALRRMPEAERTKAAGRFAFHPLVLYECAVGGHNDMLMVAPAVWAFAIVDELPLIAGLLAGCAIAVKYVAVIALPFLVVRARRSGWPAAILCGVLAIVIPVLCARPFQTGAAGAQALAANGSRFAMSFEWLANMPIFAAGLGNVPAFEALPVVPVFGVLSWARIVQLAALSVAGALVVIGSLLCLRRFDMRHVWRSITALLLSLPSMHPWYGLWLVPAVSCAGRWAEYAWWFGVFVFGCYTVDTVSGWMPAWVPIAATAAYLIVPAVMAMTTKPNAEARA
ncbi:MAG TPA: glycosyltransferase 87 family protein [Candidatus Eremiobacteraceae bacterium]|nr:glycosyltransferase 87 family protein [Candidatus Eremiobacteraceae bacterium]